MTPLTRREIECVQLAGLRLSNQEIADALGLTVSTVANYLRSANAKLGTAHRRGAAEAIGIRCPGAGMTDAELLALLPQRLRPVVTPGLEKPDDDRPWLARVWRPLPRSGLVRLGLIVGITVVWLLILGGMTPVILALFEAIDVWRPS